ncbi:RCC1 domain-containing protein [Streptomyces sp. NPDC001787]|uniref:RCC1 domain-containing protein n=1 Tax=Streptomyces sp. NPDC001787 TaxID=3154523 RepID=UPI0033320245
MPRLKDAQHLAAGARHGAALIDGSVHTWGDNTEGQLGNGITTAGHQEVKLPGTPWKNIAAALAGNTTYAC